MVFVPFTGYLFIYPALYSPYISRAACLVCGVKTQTRHFQQKRASIQEFSLILQVSAQNHTSSYSILPIPIS